MVSADCAVRRDGLHLSAASATLPMAASAVRAVDLSDVELEQMLTALFERRAPHLYQKLEDAIFRRAFADDDQNQVQAVRLLGISRNILRARVLALGLSRAPHERPLDPFAQAVAQGLTA